MSSLHIRSLGDAPASLWTLNAQQVLDSTASLSPTPGGGSIAVFTAALGLALVQKGASISHKRAGEDVPRRDSLGQLSDAIGAVLGSLSRLADEDVQSFQDYVVARRLPQSTDEEKTVRRAAMEEALVLATRIPLRSGACILEALQHAEVAVELSDHHLLSDIYGGAILLQAASKAVLLNVVANVPLLADGEMGRSLEAERVELERSLGERSASIARAYEARLAAFAGVSA